MIGNRERERRGREAKEITAILMNTCESVLGPDNAARIRITSGGKDEGRYHMWQEGGVREKES